MTVGGVMKIEDFKVINYNSLNETKSTYCNKLFP